MTQMQLSEGPTETDAACQFGERFRVEMANGIGEIDVRVVSKSVWAKSAESTSGNWRSRDWGALVVAVRVCL